MFEFKSLFTLFLFEFKGNTTLNQRLLSQIMEKILENFECFVKKMRERRKGKRRVYEYKKCV